MRANAARRLLTGSIIGQWRSVVPASALFLCHQVGEVLVPVVIGATIDNAIAGGSLLDLLRWILILIAVFVVLSNSYKFGARAEVRSVEMAAHEIRSTITARTLDEGGGVEKGRPPGELVSIATADAHRVGSVNELVAGTAAALGALAASVVVVLSISVPLGVVVLGGIVPLLILTRALGKVLHRRSEAEQEKAASAAGLATDLVTGLRVLIGIGAQDAATARYRRASRISLTATLRAARTDAGMDGAAVLVTGSFLAVVALVGSRLTAAGELSVGSLIAVVGVAQFLIGPMNRLTDVASGLARAHSSAIRVARLLQSPSAVASGSETLPRTNGSLEIRRLGLPGSGQLDLRIDAGEIVGLVALAPAESDALLDVLAQNVSVTNGTILLGGFDLAGHDVGSIRDQILVSAHDASLFQGTLLANVLATAADPALAFRAMTAAALDEAAQALPDGLDTEIGERGSALSGGQRQRLALARALATDAPVLVLQDPTSAVDSVTESAIAQGIRDIRTAGATLIVTASPVLLAACDRVLLIEDGMVSRDGTHAELALDHPGYRDVVLL